MAKKRRARPSKGRKARRAKPKRTAAKRKRSAANRRANTSLTGRIADAVEVVTGAARDTERLRRKVRYPGIDEG